MALFLGCGHARAQTIGKAQTPYIIRAIKVTASRPVAKAMDVIEQRYAVPIDYVDPQYAFAGDTQVVRTVRGTPVRKPFPIPRVRTITVQYHESPGCPGSAPRMMCTNYAAGGVPVTAWPTGGITALIQRVLDRFAAQGGQVFLVRKMETTYGGQTGTGWRWLVYAEQVRNTSGRFVQQPDFLSAQILFPKPQKNPTPPRVPPPPLVGVAERRAQARKMLQEARLINESIYVQLEWAWGDAFRVDPKGPDPSFQIPDEANDDYISAWRAIANLAGPWRVLRFFYAPDTRLYYTNIVNLPSPPYRPPPRPPNPPSRKPVAQSAPIKLSPLEWLGLARVRKSVVQQLQAGLASAGYLHSQPTTAWDRNARQAILGFQIANGLPATGKMDLLTIERLEPYLPKFQPFTKPNPSSPPNPLGPALFYWLKSTRPGQRDIQRALAEEGFYNSPLTGNIRDAKTRAAMKEFQEANGLPATGLFDGATSSKLAPLLLQMKQ